MFFAHNVLYINTKGNLNVYLIVGSDSKMYVLDSLIKGFKATTEIGKYPVEDFDIANPKHCQTAIHKALRQVPTSKEFWLYALTPQVTTFEQVSYEGHDDITFPAHLNVYLTHDGEYLGCESRMIYHDVLKAFVPTNPPKVILSLGFHSIGGHFEPQVVHEPNKAAIAYTNVNAQLLKMMQLKVGEKCMFNGRLTRSDVDIVRKSLGITVRYTANPNNFNKEVFRVA